jgi:two-component system OmpR family sensor kinase
MFGSVRTRLTLWYIGVLALVLVVFSIGVYVSLTRYMYAELDNELKNTVEGTQVSLQRELAEGETVIKAGTDALDEHIGPRQAAAIFDANGSLIAEDTALGDVHASLPPSTSIKENQAGLYTISGANSTDGRRVAVKRVGIPSQAQPYLIVISQPLDEVINRLRTIRLILFLAICSALVLAGLGGWFLARRSLAPVARMTEQARQMSAEDLEKRLPVTNPYDELGRLAATFNELLSRVDDSLSQQRRFMADASHELRTPLSVMRTATGVTLEQPHRRETEYREALKVVDEQARRLTRIVTDMFTLARADAGQRALNRTEFCLDRLILECVRAAEILGAGRGVRIRVDELAETPYRGDEGLLRQLVINLLDNAVKHTPDQGEVRLTLKSQDAQLKIIISDTGSGIPPEAQSHIFERFYRVDKSRSRSEASELGAGAGLGLSIAQWIAESHDGYVKLQRSDRAGSEFVVSLPASNHV